MAYCGCGGGKPKAGTPHIFEVTAAEFSAILSVELEAPWLFPVLEWAVGQLSNAEQFCATPPPQPRQFTLLDFLPGGESAALAAEWMAWGEWRVFCECKTAAGPTQSFGPNAGGAVVCGGPPSKYRFILENRDGIAYQARIVDGVHDWTDVTGYILQWDNPDSEGGCLVDPAHSTALRDGVSTAHVQDAAGSYAIEIKGSGGCTPDVPPHLTATEPGGVSLDAPATGATLDTLASDIWRVKRELRALTATTRPTSYVAAGSLSLSGDGSSNIVADAMLLHIVAVPAYLSSEGSLPAHLAWADEYHETGYVAAGNPSGWYPIERVRWADQWLGPLPADATRISWHLAPCIAITATLYVAAS